MTVAFDKVRETFAPSGSTTAFTTTQLYGMAATHFRVYDFDESVSPATIAELLPGIGCTLVLFTPTIHPPRS